MSNQLWDCSAEIPRLVQLNFSGEQCPVRGLDQLLLSVLPQRWCHIAKKYEFKLIDVPSLIAVKEHNIFIDRPEATHTLLNEDHTSGFLAVWYCYIVGAVTAIICLAVIFWPTTSSISLVFVNGSSSQLLLDSLNFNESEAQILLDSKRRKLKSASIIYKSCLGNVLYRRELLNQVSS